MADNAPIEYTCEPARAYDFKRSEEKLVGHLVKLSFSSGETLEQDVEVANPLNGSKVKVVGVIEDISWESIKEKPIHISFRVSRVNQPKLGSASHKPDASADVKAEFVIYKYDDLAEKYHVAFSTDGSEMNFVRAKLPGTQSVYTATSPCEDIREPRNYRGNVTLIAKGQQKLLLSHSVNEKMVLEIGTNA